jgi:hypothetical protein
VPESAIPCRFYRKVREQLASVAGTDGKNLKRKFPIKKREKIQKEPKKG